MPGETIERLIEIAGGTAPRADRQRVHIRRFRAPSDPETDLLVVDLDGAARATPVLPGDQIHVFSIPDWHLRRAVDVRGEVLYPGSYVINEGEETLSDVIGRAGGLAPRAAIHSATLTRFVAADSVDKEFERLKTIDVADMTTDEYEYFKLRSRENRGRVVVDFERVLVGRDEFEDVPLRRGDRIEIPTATLAVNVSGQVASPGAVTYETGRPVKWYIERAGGYAWRAAKGKTRVIKGRSGEWVDAGKAKNLEAGDTIWVPEKPERDYWEMFKEGLAITSQVLTVYLVIDRISE